MHMLHAALLALWFLLPAAIANVAPIVAAKLPLMRRWETPIDGGKTWRGLPFLGAHKTWRGLLSGIVMGGLTFWLQQTAYRHGGWTHTIAYSVNYAHISWLLGPLMGLGALGGDAIESFFKRRHHVASGKPWIPFDQLDYIIGAVLVSLPFVVLPAAVYVWIFIIWFGMHILFSYLGWRVGLKDAPI